MRSRRRLLGLVTVIALVFGAVAWWHAADRTLAADERQLVGSWTPVGNLAGAPATLTFWTNRRARWWINGKPPADFGFWSATAGELVLDPETSPVRRRIRP